jgi:DNA polymerase III delta' subunit
VDRLTTRGQPVALAAVRAMLAAAAPHAILFTGPGGAGKTTLALDLASGLLCVGATGADRPCGSCRGCRMVASGNHPDLHRLGPAGPGGQIRIGRREDPEPGTVRRLTADLALLPMEGGARIAILEHADRLNEDAQTALLKTLEEPPGGVTIVLCADEEERLLDTVRSRCARVRLGVVGPRDIESLLGDRGVADPPTAARLARMAGGRPGLALAYAAAPEAVVARGEIARSLLDLLDAGRAARLEAIGPLVARAAEHARLLDPNGGTRPARGPDAGSAGSVAESPDAASGDAASPDRDSAGRAPAAERRRAADSLLGIWRDVSRDLAVTTLGHPERVRDPGLLDDLARASVGLDSATLARFLERLGRAGELVAANVAPELVVDGLVLAWPRRPRVAA